MSDLAQLLSDVRDEATLLRRRGVVQLADFAGTPVAFLYYLADPRTPRWPRYVGMTKNLAERARSHAKRSVSANAAIVAWKEELRAAGIEARAAEWRLIHRWRRRGLCDLNWERDGSADNWTAFCAARLARLGLA